MIIRLTNTIGAIGRRLGIVTKNLQMWLGFYKSDVIGKDSLIGWDFTSGWSTSSATIIDENSFSTSVDTGYLYQSNLVEIGKTYQIRLAGTVSAGAAIRVLSNASTVYISEQTGTFDVTSEFTVSTDTFLLIRGITATGTFDVSDFELKEVTQFAPDKSTNSNDAKLFTGKALSFNGNDSVVLDGFTSSGDTFTFAFWAKETTSGATKMILDINPSRFIITYKNGVLNIYSGGYVAFKSMPINEFSRVIVAINGTSISVYINGEKYGDTKTLNSALNITNATVVRLGGEYTNLPQYYFNGLLSDFQIYNASWVQSDVTFDYNNPNHLVTDNPNTTLTLSNLSAYYALSEGSGSKIYDSTGLGAELVVNGDFDTDSNWNKNSNWSIPSPYGLAVADGTNSNNINQGADDVPIGKTFTITYTISEYISGSFKVAYGGVFTASKSAVGTYTERVTSIAGTRLSISGVNQKGSISNISVKEVKADDGTAYDQDGTSIGATWVDQQPTIPQLGLMDWSKGSNLYLFSEPTVDEGSAIGATYESFTWGNTSGANFTNCVRFGDNSVDRYRYGATVPSSVDATLSCYVIMDDLSEPNVGQDSSSGDFSIVIGGTVGSAITVTSTSVGGNVWRISKTRDTATTSLPNNGIVKYTTQSAKGFRVVGWQIEESSTVGSFIGTNGSAASNATLIQNPNDLGKDVLGNSLRLRERGFNLDGSGYAEVLGMGLFIDDFTFSAWVKLSDDDFLMSESVILESSGSLFMFGGSMTYVRAVNGAFTNQIVSYSFVVNTWYHIAVTRIKNGNQIMYIDSALINTVTAPNTTININNTTIGKDATTRISKSIQDETKIYNRALTSKEITNNYKVGLNAHKVGSAFSTEFSSEFGF